MIEQETSSQTSSRFIDCLHALIAVRVFLKELSSHVRDDLLGQVGVADRSSRIVGRSVPLKRPRPALLVGSRGLPHLFETEIGLTL